MGWGGGCLAMLAHIYNLNLVLIYQLLFRYIFYFLSVIGYLIARDVAAEGNDLSTQYISVYLRIISMSSRWVLNFRLDFTRSMVLAVSSAHWRASPAVRSPLILLHETCTSAVIRNEMIAPNSEVRSNEEQGFIYIDWLLANARFCTL